MARLESHARPEPSVAEVSWPGPGGPAETADTVADQRAECVVMDAMKLMQKMGWKPGQGLGKHSQGDSTSITVEVKQDNRGVGIPSSADHWDDMYNAAIKSISVASDGKSSKELTSRCALQFRRTFAQLTVSCN